MIWLATIPEVPPGWTPDEIASAVLKGGWPIFGLLALLIVCRYWPWRKTKE